MRHLGTQHRKPLSSLLIPYSFLVPWLVALGVFYFGAIGYTIVLSLMKYNLIAGGSFIGLDNYRNVFADKLFWLSLKNTLVFLVMFIPANLVVSLSIAMLLNKQTRTVGLNRLMIYLPAVIPSVAGAMLIRLVFIPSGIVNGLLEIVGIEGPFWLSNPHLIKTTSVLFMLWLCGTSVVIYLAGLKSIPTTYYEVGIIDGIGPLRKFFSITLPMLSPTIFFRLVIDVIVGLMIMIPGLVLPVPRVPGGPANASRFYAIHLYDKAFKRFLLGEGSALAIVLLCLCALITYFIIRLGERRVYYEI